LPLPTGHRLARAKTPARLDQLEGETVLLLDDGHCFRDQALAVCRRAGADEASVRATSLSTLAQMVAGGAGITLLPRIASVPRTAREDSSHVRSARTARRERSPWPGAGRHRSPWLFARIAAAMRDV